MWNYLKGRLRIGRILGLIMYGIWTLLMDICGLAAVVSILRNPLAGLIGAAIMVPAAYFTTKGFFEYFENSTPVPYWENKFSKDVVIKLLAEDEFSPYIMHDGTVCRSVKVSKSGRWFSVKNRYYPISLIKSISFKYNSTLCDYIEMIDGERLYDQDWIWTDIVKKSLTEIIQEGDAYDKAIYKDAFDKVTGGDYDMLSKADWGDIRYRWEQKCVEIQYDNLNEKNRAKVFKEVASPRNVKDHFFERSLTDDELDAIVENIYKRRIKDINIFLDKDKYEDERFLFNGIRLLEKLGYPGNAKGEDFLFECIKDIKKPYCDDAVKTLLTFPRDVLIRRIDSDIQKAHATDDLLWAAGLIALAKEIDYEIVLGETVTG